MAVRVEPGNRGPNNNLKKKKRNVEELIIKKKKGRRGIRYANEESGEWWCSVIWRGVLLLLFFFSFSRSVADEPAAHGAHHQRRGIHPLGKVGFFFFIFIFFYFFLGWRFSFVFHLFCRLCLFVWGFFPFFFGSLPPPPPPPPPAINAITQTKITIIITKTAALCNVRSEEGTLLKKYKKKNSVKKLGKRRRNPIKWPLTIMSRSAYNHGRSESTIHLPFNKKKTRNR